MNKLRFSLTALLIMLAAALYGNVSLPSFFSDNMVLQRNADVTIWGWASPNEEITIISGWSGEHYKTKADKYASWKIVIKTPGAGGPYTLNIKGYNELVFKNVMLGEVWFCSGQSNMVWPASAGIDNAAEEIARANYPNIRFFTVPQLSASSPQINVTGDWQICTPEVMKYSGAIGYFFAQHLQQNLENVPIGIINSSWGGTPAEIWIPEEVIVKDPVLTEAASKLGPAEWGPIEPAKAYNAMVHPFAGFKIAGILWYQGESNVGSGVYDKTLAALIRSWRAAWLQDLPFYYVQIAPYDYGDDKGYGVVVRNSQRKVLETVQNTGMVVIGDVSPIDDIHPRNKKPVGIRLANLALKSHYNILNGSVSGPLYKSSRPDNGKIIVYFDNAEGLRFTKKESSQFEVAGIDGIFHPAKAKISGSTIIVSSSAVKAPLHVRYAWKDTAQPDLFNNAGLPASSFSSQ